MHRTDATDFSTDIGNGERGFKESPAGNETVVAANFMNAIQEELAYVVTQAGLILRASGAADAAAQWQQLYPAIEILITNAVSALTSDDIANSSGIIGADVSAALDQLGSDSSTNSAAIAAHISNLAAHLASAITNNSSVTGAKVSDALNSLLTAINTHTAQIGSNAGGIAANNAQIAVNAAGIGTNAGNIAVNSAAIAGLEVREWKVTMADITSGTILSQNSTATNAGLTAHGWTDLDPDDVIEFHRTGNTGWGAVGGGDIAERGMQIFGTVQSATEISMTFANMNNSTQANFNDMAAWKASIRVHRKLS